LTRSGWSQATSTVVIQFSTQARHIPPPPTTRAKPTDSPLCRKVRRLETLKPGAADVIEGLVDNPLDDLEAGRPLIGRARQTDAETGQSASTQTALFFDRQRC
jgi:hypothetical protein